jgi:hypothetical protein
MPLQAIGYEPVFGQFLSFDSVINPVINNLPAIFKKFNNWLN